VTRPHRRILLAAALAAAVLAAGGCGYGLLGQTSNVPADVKSVYIAPFVNRTPRAQLDQFVTRAIADELVRRRRFDVVGSAEGADAELSGEVNQFAVTPVGFDAEGRATEYEISVAAAVVFGRGEGEEVIWENANYQFRKNYPVDESITSYLDRENQAIEEAAKSFAETMVSDLLLGF
jgi:outer membrane lipopolysaccharide assembly protein LptE/RlpB